MSKSKNQNIKNVTVVHSTYLSKESLRRFKCELCGTIFDKDDYFKTCPICGSYYLEHTQVLFGGG